MTQISVHPMTQAANVEAVSSAPQATPPSCRPPDELRVLLIEDNKDDAVLITRALRQIGRNVRFNRVDTQIALRDALEESTWDVVVSDYSLPRFNGMVALAIVRELAGEIPFILVSGTIGEEAAAAAVKAGANDYVMKGNLSRLVSTVERELKDSGMRVEHARSQRAIREIDERNRAIITTAADGILTFDGQGVVDAFNPAAERIFGFPESEIVGRNLASLFAPSAVELAQNLILACGSEGRSDTPISAAGPQFHEIMGQRKDGRSVSLEMAVSTLRIGDRGLYTAIVHDLTQRKENERLIRQQLERISALRAIDVAITGSFDIRVTLSIVLDQVVNLLAVDAAAVLLYDEASCEFTCSASRGFRTQVVRRSRVRLGEGLAGKAAAMRRIIESANLAADRSFTRRELVQTEEVVAYCALPLIAKGNVLGILEVYNRTPMEFDADLVSYFEVLGGQAAIAMDSALMFESLQRKNAELTVAYDVTIEGWAGALDLRDKETQGHSRRVSDMTVRLARMFGVPEAEIVHMRRGALLHDIGKLGVPDGILLKQGPLTDEEWTVMRKHPQLAYDWLSPVEFLKSALDIPYCHHEKWDGSGYPRGLAGDVIPLAARLFAIVDVWDGLTSDRPYREAWSHDRTLDFIRGQSGIHFDPRVAEVFVRLVEENEQQLRDAEVPYADAA
jgi:PAS domain S-box-containing protein